MQQELMEMLEEVIQYVEVWKSQDQEVIDKAEALIKKTKNNAHAVPQEQPDTFYERNAKFREENWQTRFDAAVEARRQAQEQLYSERERHASEIQALRQEISRLLPSPNCCAKENKL